MIQSMHDAIVSIWNKLQISKEERHSFESKNSGYAMEIVRAVS